MSISLDTSGALVLLSGGQDSTTCLYWALQRFARVEALAIHYHQRHSIELEQARLIAGKAGVQLHILETDLFSRLTETALTHSDVAVQNDLNPATGLPNTFVPGRNLVFLTLAGMKAWQLGLANIVGGMCQTDYSGYPDCREPFVQSTEQTLRLGLDANYTIHTPLMHLDKAKTWLLAQELGCLDVVVQHSHTCYNGDRTSLHPWGYGCGTCPACQLRKNGYEKAFDSK